MTWGRCPQCGRPSYNSRQCYVCTGPLDMVKMCPLCRARARQRDDGTFPPCECETKPPQETSDA